MPTSKIYVYLLFKPFRYHSFFGAWKPRSFGFSIKVMQSSLHTRKNSVSLLFSHTFDFFFFAKMFHIFASAFIYHPKLGSLSVVFHSFIHSFIRVAMFPSNRQTTYFNSNGKWRQLFKLGHYDNILSFRHFFFKHEMIIILIILNLSVKVKNTSFHLWFLYTFHTSFIPQFTPIFL